ncbi:hypothetical protein Pfo_009982 [Paulownia fortunei]|nr:hypothetical protein Pfo_009982 [Paulownia fortunei]
MTALRGILRHHCPHRRNPNGRSKAKRNSSHIFDPENPRHSPPTLPHRLILQCRLSTPPPPTPVDDGKNPDEFTRDMLNGCISQNQITTGKMDTFKSLRGHLLEELEQAFPDEAEAYREIRATSAAPARLCKSHSDMYNSPRKVNKVLVSAPRKTP